MRTKKITRTRAWCDFCKKGMWSVKKMEIHEKHCTMNPNRICRVCKSLLDQDSTPLPELIAICRKAEIKGNQFMGITVPESLHLELRHAAQQCPACEMAALRQSGIPCPAVPGFDFKREMQSIWDDVNDAKSASCNYGY